MPARELTLRLSIAALRAQFAPRIYRGLTSVRLEHGGIVCNAALITIPAHGSVKAPQRRLVCPQCAKPVLVLGVVEGKGWVCAACGRWRSRDRPRSVAGALRNDANGSVREDDSGIAEHAAATGRLGAMTPGVSRS